MVKKSWIFSSEAVIAYLNRGLVHDPLSDEHETNAGSVEVTFTPNKKSSMVNEDESVQEIKTTVENALANWAKFYKSNCILNTWNRGQIRAGGLHAEHLPLTPQVHLSYTRASPLTLIHAPQTEADTAATDAILTKALSKQVDIRRAVTRQVKWKKCQDSLKEPKQGYTVADQNIAVAQAQAMSSTVANLISQVQHMLLSPNLPAMLTA